MTISYDASMAQVQMTLSAIAYTPDSNGGASPTPGDITTELSKTGYATGGDWSLAWGPGYSTYDDNMMYVVQKTPGTYSLVIRGTQFNSLTSWFEDFPTGMTDVSAWTGGDVAGTTPYVSDKFYTAITTLMTTPGPVAATGQTMDLAAFLDGLASANSSLTLYITGHSQGGGLAPVLLAWLISHAAANWPSTDATMIGYGFAPPTSGGANFASWVKGNPDGGKSGNASASFLVKNPNDIVPFAYDQIMSIWLDGVPIAVTDHTERDAIIAAALGAVALAGSYKTVWAQAGEVTILPSEADPEGGSYFSQVEAQHNHNSYLILLGAPPTDIPSKSPLTPPS